MNEEISGFNDNINRLFDNITVENAKKANSVTDIWKNVVCSIQSKQPNLGKKISEHSRVVDLKNGILLVEVDHPGWINILNIYKKYIINGINMKAPKLEVSTIAFKLKGSDVQLYDTRSENERIEDEKVKLENKLNEEEVKLKKFDKENSNSDNKELPPELVAIFNNMKNSMLTNNKE